MTYEQAVKIAINALDLQRANNYSFDAFRYDDGMKIVIACIGIVIFCFVLCEVVANIAFGKISNILKDWTKWF